MYGSLYFDVRLAIANDSVAVDTFVEGHTVAYIQVEVLTKVRLYFDLGEIIVYSIDRCQICGGFG